MKTKKTKQEIEKAEYLKSQTKQNKVKERINKMEDIGNTKSFNLVMKSIKNAHA